jgi:hypothetical protein
MLIRRGGICLAAAALLVLAVPPSHTQRDTSTAQGPTPPRERPVRDTLVRQRYRDRNAMDADIARGPVA